MAENTATETVAAPPAEVKKTKKAAIGGAKKAPKAKPNHPPTSDMVNSAIKNLKERGGSSLLAIKKYLAVNYKVDSDKLAPFIKKYLKVAVTSGTLIQTKGKGASGSFKLPAGAKEKGQKVKKSKQPATEKKVAKPKKKATKPETKKSTATKKSAIGVKKDKKESASAAKTAKKSGVVKAKPKAAPKQKPTKPTKAAAKSPKAPKPKKAAGKAKKPVASKKYSTQIDIW